MNGQVRERAPGMLQLSADVCKTRAFQGAGGDLLGCIGLPVRGQFVALAVLITALCGLSRENNAGGAVTGYASP